MNFTLTQKERMLLEDQKTHEQICIEKYNKYACEAQDPKLKQILKENEQAERTHLNTINQLLSGTIPQMNQQQGQQQGQQAQQQSQGMQSQGMQQAQGAGMQQQNNAQSTQGQLTDKDICTDLLMTEKYVSGAYDTAIFEFTNPQVRDVLNHIQKEEQQHGEKIFNYMQNNGMYNVQ